MALAATLVALGTVAASGLASGLIGPTAPDVTLPIWRSSYGWAAGDGYSGWHGQLLTPDAQAYGRETQLGGRPGLWLWPVGERQYGPGGAAWVLRAPGTTRIARATIAVSYRNSLFAHHCLKIGLRAGGDVRDGVVACKPPSPPASQDNYQVQLADPSGQPLAKELSIEISVPACAKSANACTKWIPVKDPLGDGPVVRVKSADLVLVDDDRPVVAPSGAFFDLDGRYIDGRQTYPLRVASSDAGAGITDIDIEHRGWPGPQPPLAQHPVDCDAQHRTPSLDARTCRPADSIDLDVDTRSMPEGTRQFLAYSPDVAGNIGERAWTVIIDRTAPTAPQNLRFTTPDEGSAQAAWDAAADPSLPDGTPGSGVAHYRERHRVGDGEWSDWETSDDATRLGDEVYDQPAGTRVAFEVEAIDAVGNVSDVARTGGEVYGSPPRVGLSGPLADLDGRYVGGEPEPVTVTADDDGAGVRRVWLERDGAGEAGSADAGCTPRTKPDGAPYKAQCPAHASGDVQVDTASLPEGRATFRGGAEDRAHNRSSDPTATVLVDHGAPQPDDPSDLGLDASLDPATSEATIEWGAFGDPALPDGTPGSGDVRYTYRLRRANGDLVEGTTPYPQLIASQSAVGETFDVEIRAQDAVGNVSAVMAGQATVSAPQGAAACEADAEQGAYPSTCGDGGQVEEDETDEDVTLEPVTSTSASRATARAAASFPAAIYRIDVHGGLRTTVRSAPRSYAIGNAFDGSLIFASGDDPQSKYLYGDITSYRDHCGWISGKLAGAFNPGPASSHCDPKAAAPDVRRFSRHKNCEGDCKHGTAVYLTGPTPECGNTYPVPNGITDGCQDHIHDITAWRGYCVEWRYVTTDGVFVMVKDRNFSNPNGSWVFIKRSALTRRDRDLPNINTKGRGHCPDTTPLS